VVNEVIEEFEGFGNHFRSVGKCRTNW